MTHSAMRVSVKTNQDFSRTYQDVKNAEFGGNPIAMALASADDAALAKQYFLETDTALSVQGMKDKYLSGVNLHGQDIRSDKFSWDNGVTVTFSEHA